MSESKKGVHQISPNSFLFFNSPEIFYSISLEEVQDSKIQINIIKILETKTFIYVSIVDFSEFGTGDISAKDTIKNLDFIIYNYNFFIKEEENKINILFNTKNPKNIELNLHKLELDEEDKFDLGYKEQINQIENRIQELNNVIIKQEEEINVLQKNEFINLNRIKTLGGFTENLLNQINNKNKSNQSYGSDGNNNNNNQYNNNYNNKNQFSNNNNQYNINNNIINRNKTYDFNQFNNTQKEYNQNQYNNNMNNQNQNNFYNNNNNNNINLKNPYINQNNDNNNNIINNPYTNNNMNEFQNDFQLEKRRTLTMQPKYNNYNFDVYKNNNNNQGYNPYG